MDPRTARALPIAATTSLHGNEGRWIVPSQSGPGRYKVTLTSDGDWVCTCPDHESRSLPCKHILAVEITVKREGGGSQPPYTEATKVKYSQNRHAYNLAQTHEKERFFPLLAELCSTIPPRPKASGARGFPSTTWCFRSCARRTSECLRGA